MSCSKTSTLIFFAVGFIAAAILVKVMLLPVYIAYLALAFVMMLNFSPNLLDKFFLLCIVALQSLAVATACGLKIFPDYCKYLFFLIAIGIHVMCTKNQCIECCDFKDTSICAAFGSALATSYACANFKL